MAFTHKAGFFRDLLAIVEQASVRLCRDAAGGRRDARADLRAGALRAARTRAAARAGGRRLARSAAFNLSQSGVAMIGAVSTGSPPSLFVRQLELVGPVAGGDRHRAHEFYREHRRRARVRGAGGAAASPNRELLALGCANAAGGLLGAMPAGGGTTQTAVNRKAGARTQLAALVTAAVSLATLLVLAPLSA